jgi:prefoldin subunit 5
VAKGLKLNDKEGVELELMYEQRKVDELRRQIAEAERKIDALNAEMDSIDESIEKLAKNEQGDGRQTRDDSDRVRLDASHATQIRKEISDVLIAAAGTGVRLEERLERARRMGHRPEHIRSIKELERVPFFIVRFKDGAQLIGVPDEEHPSQVECYDSCRGAIGQCSMQNEKDDLPPAKVIFFSHFPPGLDKFKIVLGCRNK